MTFLTSKFNKIKDKILSEKGSLDFFVVIKRFDIDNKWDLLISGEWITESNLQADLVYVIELLKSEYEDKIDFISKILLLAPNEDFINDLAKAVITQDIPMGYKGELLVDTDTLISEINILYFNSDKYKNIDFSDKEIVELPKELVFE